MKYYNIGRTNETEVIGFYPQTTRAEGYNVDSIYNILPNVFPDHQPLYGLMLNPKSIDTDILDGGILEFGMVVSHKFKILLEKFNLPPNRFYSIDVFGTEKKYYWFHYITQIERFINFNATELELYKRLPPFEVEKKIYLSSYDDIVNLSRELVVTRGKSLRYSFIQLNKSFPNYDLFEITGAQCFTLISERLKNEIIKERITGIEFVEYEKIAKVE